MKKNKLIEPRRQMKTATVKVIVILFLTVFLINFVASADWDNTKEYNPETKTITVNNLLGLGGEIAKIKLNTPQNYKVGLGLQKVAEFTITSSSDFDGFLDDLEFYNLNDNGKQITKEYIIKYKDFENITVDDFIENCEKDINNNSFNVCNRLKIGDHIEQKEIWRNKLTYNVLDKEVITLGIFVNANEGDRVEWIPTLFGVNIDEWASWTASLNTGLGVYYDFQEGTGTEIEDQAGHDNNGTLTGGHWVSNASCKASLGTDCLYFDGDDDVINMTWTAGAFDWPNAQSYSGNLWVKFDTTQVMAANNPTIFDRQDSNSGWLSLITDDDNVWRFSGSATRTDVYHTTDITDDAYHMITIVRDVTQDKMKIYIDGEPEGNETDATTVDFTGVKAGSTPSLMAYWSAGSIGRETTGYMINAIFWNRTITDAEVTQLWNGGDGILLETNTAPTITLNEPDNDYNTTDLAITFNCSATDDIGVLNITMFVDGVNVNLTTGGVGENLSIERIETLTEGSHNWSCNAWDIEGESTSDVRNLTIDVTAPTITITEPLSNISNFTEPLEVNFNASIFEDGVGLNVCTYSNGSINNTITCGENVTLSLGSGWNTLSYWVNDSLGNMGYNYTTFFINVLNYTTTVKTPIITQDNFTVFLNVSATELSTATANLTYNGTTYIMVGSNNGTHSILNKTLTAPFVLADTNFWINITTNIVGTEYIINNSQLVYAIPTLEFNTTPCTDLALNFSMFDEQNLSLINATFKYNFAYGTTANNTLSKSYGTLTNSHNLYVCINDTASSNWTIGRGEIFYSTDGYASRRYYLFNGSYIYNNSRQIDLYDLLTTEQTSFKLEIEGTSLDPYSSKYATLVRWYPDLDSYNVVDMGFTDETGSTVIHVETEDTDYRIGVYEANGSLIKLADPIRMVCLVSPCTYTLKIFPTDVDYISLLNIDYTFTFNETSNIWTYIFSDTTGYTQSMNLTIYKMTGSGFNSVCSDIITGSSGAITCNTTGQTGTLKGEVVRTASPPVLIAQKTISVGTTTFNSSWGLWLSMLLVIPIIFVFAFMSPIGMVIGVIIALILALYFGSINVAILGGVAVLGGIVLHFIKRIG